MSYDGSLIGGITKMISGDSLDGFGDVHGRVAGQTERDSRSGSRELPFVRAFLFRAFSMDTENLRVCVSDFRARTWQADFSVHQLQNLRDEVGLGGTWKDFLAYVRSALSSDIVKLVLGEPVGTKGGHDVTTATLVAQKAKGTPRLCLSLSNRQGSEADEAKVFISFGLYESLLSSASALSTEKEQSGVLRDALLAEKAQTEKLLQQIDSSNPTFLSRKKPKSDPVRQFPVIGSITHHLVPTHLDVQDSLVPAASPVKAGTSDARDITHGSGVGKGAAPITRPPRRNKRRGTTIGEEEDF